MKLAIVHDDAAAPAASNLTKLADLDGDGFDDETGEPVDPDAEAEPDPEAEPEEEDAAEGAATRQRWLLAVEGAPTGDGRYYEEGAFTWRDLPLPFMALDKTTEAHDEARLVANLVAIERSGSEIIGYTEMIESDDEYVLNLQRLIDQGDLRGVSVDMDNIAGEIIIQADEPMAEPMEEEGGEIRIPIGGDSEQVRFSAARIIGATAVPFPAFAEAQRAEIEHEAVLVAGAGSQLTAPAEKAPVEAPAQPPRAWFAPPELAGPTALTVTADGRVFGHLALWESCHIGFQDRCVQAPRSACNYEAFHSGSLITAEGEQVRVGQITADAGHAAISASASAAKEHYDHTGWAAADVRCGEDDNGIWIAGALRPGLDAARLRAFMAADVSGDWRRISGNLELVAVASVNVPGFTKAQFNSGDRVALVASMPICEQGETPSLGYRLAADRIAATIGRSYEQKLAAKDELAFALGRHPSQLREQLARRVRG